MRILLSRVYFILFLFLSPLLTPPVFSQAPPSGEVSLESIFEKAKDISTLRSLLIQQNEELLGEEYFRNASADYPYNIKSASKSIISLLVGIAVDRGEIATGETLGDYFPEYFSNHPDSVKESITIRDMLSMQAGLETTSFHNYGRWAISDNWAEFQLEQPLTEEPGGKMVYSTGVSHLLSVILTKATEMSTRQFANRYLFGPLDIRVGGWDRDPQGYYMGGNNMALTPNALLKIGQLMLNGGEYEGQRIISKQWVRASFGSYTRSNFNPYNYGYMWWNRKLSDYQVFFAWGFGGQYIFMLPELNSVVVMTSYLNNATQERRYKEPVFDLLEHHIIPFLARKGGK